MLEAIGQILGFAIGVAISPVPIIAVILMLFSARAASNSLAFATGWLLGLAVVSAIVLLLELGSADDGDTGGWAKVVIGVLFLGLAVKQWRSRPEPGEEPTMPGWMSAIDDFSAAKSFAIGALLSGVNPKNFGLTLAAASTIGAAELSASEDVVVVAVYILIASVTILVPVIGYLVARETMRPWLDSMKAWLMLNNATVMAVLLVVLGAKVLGDGISLVAG